MTFTCCGPKGSAITCLGGPPGISPSVWACCVVGFRCRGRFLFDRTETRGPSEKGNDEKVKRNEGRVRTERIDGHNMIQ